MQRPRFEEDLKLREVERCGCGIGQTCTVACTGHPVRKSCPAFFKEYYHPSMKVIVKTGEYRKSRTGKGSGESELEEVVRERMFSKRDRRKMARVKSKRRRPY